MFGLFQLHMQREISHLTLKHYFVSISSKIPVYIFHTLKSSCSPFDNVNCLLSRGSLILVVDKTHL